MMKQDIKINLTKSDIEDYDRSVYMSEYVTIPKARLRRLIISEVIAWGLSAFILLVTLLR
jgi:hypothetical protein